MDKITFTCSVVTPMYNEESNIQTFYDRIKAVLEPIKEISSFEIICVNDGSKDSTFEKLVELNKKDSRVKVINLSRNFGKEIALSAGLDASETDICIPIDADLQDPPEVIPELITKWKEGYDVVYATRSFRAGETATKKMTSFLFYRFIQYFSNINIPKDTGDFRLMDKKVVNALKEIREQHRFMKGLFAWVGFKSTSVVYQRDARFSGITKWNYWKLFNLALEGITSFSYIPLRFASFIGILVSLSAFVYGFVLIILKIISGNDAPGFTSIMVALLFLSGIQLVTIGLIGEYIGRTYTESKRRPLYFVRDRIGFN